MQLAAAAVYLALAVLLIPTLGLQNDETLFANGLFAPVTVADSLRTPLGETPLMLVSYTGSLKTWLYAAVFWMFEPSTWSIRIPVALLGAAAVGLFVRHTQRAAGSVAAIVGAALLATDPTFLLTVSFDWGPVALQAFLAVGCVSSWVAHTRSGERRWALLAGLLAGLALWNKALFLWNVAGLTIATVAVYRRKLRNLLTPVGAAAFAAGLGGGSWPLLLYNWRTEGATFTQNAGLELSWAYVVYKLRVLVETLDGSALYGYMLEQPGQAGPSTLLAALFLVVSVATVAAPALRRDRLLRWAVIAFWASYVPMFIGRDVGVGSHHVALLWPLPQLALAAAAARLAAGSGTRRLAVAAAVGFTLLFNLRFVAEFQAASARQGPAMLWTHAIDDLHAQVAKLDAPGIVLLDWGMLAQLRVLGQGRLSLVWGADPFRNDRPELDQIVVAESMLDAPGYVFVDHADGRRVFPGVRERFDAWLERSGRIRIANRTILDEAGRPIFELFRVAPLDAARSSD